MFFENTVARGPFWFNDLIVISSHGHLFLNYMVREMSDASP